MSAPDRDTDPSPAPADPGVLQDVADDLLDLQAAVRGVDASLTEVIALLRRQAADARKARP